MLNLDESSGFAVPVNMNVTDAANAPNAANANAAAPASRANILSVTLDRGRNPREKWGFRLTGGKDRGLPLQLLQVRNCYTFYLFSKSITWSAFCVVVKLDCNLLWM